MRLSALHQEKNPEPVPEQKPAVVVLGLGNTLLGDDGAGVRVVQALKSDRRVLPRVHLIDGGTLSFSLLDNIQNTDALIVVDAAQLGEAPGTVRIYKDLAMDEFLRSKHGCSVHEVSLAELLDMARLTGCLPAHRAFIGIQPELIDWNTDVSASVRSGLDTASIHVRALIARWSI